MFFVREQLRPPVTCLAFNGVRRCEDLQGSASDTDAAMIKSESFKKALGAGAVTEDPADFTRSKTVTFYSIQLGKGDEIADYSYNYKLNKDDLGEYIAPTLKSTTEYLYGDTFMNADNALVMNIATGGGTLVHEIVHPFMEANFPACPSWFNEGLGSLYEQSGARDGRIVRRRKGRPRRGTAAQGNGGAADLPPRVDQWHVAIGIGATRPV